jgi:hypothetical protein
MLGLRGNSLLDRTENCSEANRMGWTQPRFLKTASVMGQDGNLDHPQQNHGEGPKVKVKTPGIDLAKEWSYPVSVYGVGLRYKVS